jgi:FixJ family two-component response regulator
MDRAMQTESIVYLIHDDERVKERASQIARQMGVATQSVDSVEEFIELYDDSRDSCLITDLQLHNGNGFELLRAIEDQSIFMPSIFITSHADVKSAVEVMRSGAVTLLEIPFHDDDVRDAIDFAIQRDAIERNNNLRRHTIRARIDSLTDKERQVLEYVVEGMANKVIAKRLGVSIRTIESRRQAVFQKMKVNSLAELVRCVVESESGGF